MRWATFLYQVATDSLSDRTLGTAYCDYFSHGDAFDRAMRPDTQAVPCRSATKDGWTVATMFTLRCSNPLASKTCDELAGDTQHERARIVATGALLHLIQDSYSQAHCERGQCEYDAKHRVVAKVRCVPLRMFTTYSGQDAKRHGQADLRPTFDAATCVPGGPVDDPITASAKVLWDVQHHESVAVFTADMHRVFGTSEEAKALPPASFGACFGDPPAGYSAPAPAAADR